MESRVRLRVGPLGAVLAVAVVAALVAPAAAGALTANRVKDINPGAALGGGGPLVNMGGTLYFSGNDGVHGGELWKTDGTAAGTVMVADTGSPGQFYGVYPDEITAVELAR